MSYKLPPALRRRVLAEESNCRKCGAPATEVDHIVSRANLRSWGLPEALVVEFGDRRDNLQALCRGCHAKKTDAEFAGARDRFGKLWAQRKEARQQARTAPARPREPRCELCGSRTFFSEMFCDFICDACDSGIDPDGGIQD